MKLDGFEWNSIERCAMNQKYLYQSIEFYKQQHGKLPNQDSEIEGRRPRNTWKCPAGDTRYELHLENYGNPRAVLISDAQDRHPTTFLWWCRGLSPQVQTMGDGKIHLFRGGKLLTMAATEKSSKPHTN